MKDGRPKTRERGDERAERLGRELRANLARRKAQARQRREQGAGADDPAPQTDAQGEPTDGNCDLNGR